MNLRKTDRFGGKLFLSCAATLTLPMAATACPICDGPTGQQVRDGIFNDAFWGTLLGVISPFPVLLLCLAAYHYGIPMLGKKSTIQGQVGSGRNKPGHL